MLDSVINTIGMCLIGGKYMLMIILAGMAFFSGAASFDLLMVQGLQPAEWVNCEKALQQGAHSKKPATLNAAGFRVIYNSTR